MNDTEFDIYTKYLLNHYESLTGAPGAFYLLGPGAPEWRRSDLRRVADEPIFEAEFRERGDANGACASHALVFLGY